MVQICPPPTPLSPCLQLRCRIDPNYWRGGRLVLARGRLVLVLVAPGTGSSLALRSAVVSGYTVKGDDEEGCGVCWCVLVCVGEA